MKKTKHGQPRQVSPGLHRLRRPKSGLSKQITFWVSEEEKLRIEQAADASGVSLSRFVLEKALKAARKVLSETKPHRPAKVKFPPSNPSSQSGL